MDFLHFFSLREDPFKLTPDPAYFFPSSSHNEGLLLMDYSIEQMEGFFLVIGDPGTGKTTLLNVFLEKWKERAEIAMILTPRLSPEEFLLSVIEDFHITPEHRNKNEMIRALRDFMVQKAREGKRIIIVVDEAQNLPDETLEELRLLSNLETDKEKLLQIILIGQPELDSRLQSAPLRQLNQRITTRIHLQHFTVEETADYVSARLIKAGRKNLTIQKNAVTLIHRLSHGVPRLINMIMSRALMAAYLEETFNILQKHIHHAVKSLNHSDIKIKTHSRLLRAALAGVFTAAAVVTAGYLLGSHILAPHAPRYSDTRSTAHPAGAPAFGDTEICEEKYAETVPGRNMKFISVREPYADILARPAGSSESVGLTTRGSSFVVLQEMRDEQNTTWYQILYKGNKRWISEELVEQIEAR